MACQTGNLDRVFRDAALSKSDLVRYRRLAVIHAVVCWVVLVLELIVFLVPTFMAENELITAMAPFGVHVPVSDQLYLRVLGEVITTAMFVYAAFSWLIFYSLNYIGSNSEA